MTITMIKKLLSGGEPCRKCAQAEALLRRRGLWARIDEVVIAEEDDPESPGQKLAREHGVHLAPFFLDRTGETVTVYTSVLELMAKVLAPPPVGKPAVPGAVDPDKLCRELEGAAPQDVVLTALELFGKECALAFSGAEDVVLIDMAVTTRRPFSVMVLDTGRLHPETYRFIDQVREHFGIQIHVAFPDPVSVEALVREKGLFSFYRDGHEGCCGVRKVEPLRRVLRGYRAWISGQRRDQSPTRRDVPVVALDTTHGNGASLFKWNPLAAWSLGQVWEYIRDNKLPYNPLHDQGFVSIGCEPCTRAVRPGEHERAGRWWWEEATRRECGLHNGR